jgi:hypothetical protein
MPEKIAGSFKLIGYIFWLNATWFLWRIRVNASKGV